MTPNIQIQFGAVLLSVVVTFFYGFIWYGPLFGKIWGREMGYDPNERPSNAVFIKGMIFMVIGNFLLAWVFANNMAVWNPVTWSQPASDLSPLANALMASVFTWLGFYFPGDLGSTVWEKKSWTLFTINTVYHFISLLITALILSYW